MERLYHHNVKNASSVYQTEYKCVVTLRGNLRIHAKLRLRLALTAEFRFYSGVAKKSHRNCSTACREYFAYGFVRLLRNLRTARVRATTKSKNKTQSNTTVFYFGEADNRK